MTARQISAEKAYYYFLEMKQTLADQKVVEADCLDEAKYTYLALADDDFNRASAKFARKQIVGMDNETKEDSNESLRQSLKAWVCEWRIEWPQTSQVSLA